MDNLFSWDPAPRGVIYGLTSAGEGFVDELSCRIEVDAHVKGGGVVGLDAVIGDVHPRVGFRSAAPLALGTVEDVRDAEFGQLTPVWGDFPAEIFLRWSSHQFYRLGRDRTLECACAAEQVQI